MIKFLKDSIRELKHVVWPTREENINYFITVLSVLVLFAIYLFIVSGLFKNILFKLDDIFGNNTPQIEKTISKDFVKKLDLTSGEVKINSDNKKIKIEKSDSSKVQNINSKNSDKKENTNDEVSTKKEETK